MRRRGYLHKKMHIPAELEKVLKILAKNHYYYPDWRLVKFFQILQAVITIKKCSRSLLTGERISTVCNNRTHLQKRSQKKWSAATALWKDTVIHYLKTWVAYKNRTCGIYDKAWDSEDIKSMPGSILVTKAQNRKVHEGYIFGLTTSTRSFFFHRVKVFFIFYILFYSVKKPFRPQGNGKIYAVRKKSEISSYMKEETTCPSWLKL